MAVISQHGNAVRLHEQAEQGLAFPHQVFPPGEHIDGNHDRNDDIHQRGGKADHAADSRQNIFGAEELEDHLPQRGVHLVQLIRQVKAIQQAARLGEFLQPLLRHIGIAGQGGSQAGETAFQLRDQQVDRQREQPQQQEIHNADGKRPRELLPQPGLAAQEQLFQRPAGCI